jgi:hypothetical protein
MTKARQSRTATPKRAGRVLRASERILVVARLASMVLTICGHHHELGIGMQAVAVSASEAINLRKDHDDHRSNEDSK